MSLSRMRLAPLVLLLAGLPTFATPAPAQVPEGSAVVCTYTVSGSPGTPGLFLVPLAGGPMTPITGLPAELATSGSYTQGAWSVSLRSADGAVIVGTITGASAPASQGDVKLFVLHLNGTAVDPARTQEIVLGRTTGTGAAWQSVLPDGRILVVAGQDSGGVRAIPFASGPMANHSFAMVDTSGSAPVFSLLPNPTTFPAPGLDVFGGVAIDPTGQVLYLLESGDYHFTPTNAALIRWDLATGQECQIASWLGQSAFGIACDDDGTVYVSSTDPSAVAHYVHAVRPDGCNPAAVTTVRSSNNLLAWGLDLDRASGRFAATSLSNRNNRPGFGGAQLNSLSLIDPATGSVSVVASPPLGGWGTIGNQGVAVNNAIESYGAASDGQNRYWFDNFPNPGGQPVMGNAGFSLTMTSAPGTAAASALALSFGRGSTTLMGIEVLVDLGSTVVQFVPSGLSVPYALPIPGNAGLSGLVITAQSLHLEPGNALAASRGLTVTVQ